MVDSIRCPACGQEYAASAALAGERVKCPMCGAAFDVAGSPAAPAASLPRSAPHLGRKRKRRWDKKPWGSMGTMEYLGLFLVSAPAIDHFVGFGGGPRRAIGPLTLGLDLVCLTTGLALVLLDWRKRAGRGWSGAITLLTAGILAAGVFVGIVVPDVLHVLSDRARSRRAEMLTQQLLGALNEEAGLLESIHDVPSLKSAIGELEALEARQAQLNDELLPLTETLTPRANGDLQRTYGGRREAIANRIHRERDRVMALPGMDDVIEPLGVASLRPADRSRPPAGEIPPAPAPPPTGPEAQIQQLVATHGAEQVVTIRVEGVPEALAKYVHKRVFDSSEVFGVLQVGEDQSVSVTIAPWADLESLAEAIDFGEVTETDRPKRMLTVRADPSQFPPEFRPELRDPSHPQFYQSNLAELKSADADRRRQALARIHSAEPKQLRDEIARAMEPLLRDPLASTRADAVKAWHRWHVGQPSEAALDALAGLVADGDSRVNTAAIAALADVGDERAAAALAKRLTDGSTRFTTSKLLRQMGPLAETAVAPYLQHEDGSVRYEAFAIFREIATQKSVPVLVDLLKSDEQTTRFNALEILKRLKSEQAAPAVAGLLTSIQDRGHAASVLKAVGPAAQEEVARYLTHEDRSVARDAARILAEIATEQSVPALIEALRHPQDSVRNEVLKVLGQLKDQRAVEPVASLLAGPSRPYASRALQEMGPMAEDAVLDVLDDSELRVVLECVRILEKIGTAKSLAPLSRLARDDDSPARFTAQRAVQSIRQRDSSKPSPQRAP